MRVDGKVGGWQDVAFRLSSRGFAECLTFALARHPREYGVYASMTDEEYLKHAFIRAARVAALRHGSYNKKVEKERK